MADPARQRSAKQALCPEDRSTQRLPVYARCQPHFRTSKGGILGGDVACGPGDERASAQPPQRRIEDPDASLKPGHHVGQAKPARVVQMQRQRDARSDLFGQPAAQVIDLPWVGQSRRIGDVDFLHTQRGEIPRKANHSPWVDPPFIAASQRRLDARPDHDTRLQRPRDHGG